MLSWTLSRRSDCSTPPSERGTAGSTHRATFRCCANEAENVYAIVRLLEEKHRVRCNDPDMEA